MQTATQISVQAFKVNPEIRHPSIGSLIYLAHIVCHVLYYRTYRLRHQQNLADSSRWLRPSVISRMFQEQTPSIHSDEPLNWANVSGQVKSHSNACRSAQTPT
jgi:hypothetical protein